VITVNEHATCSTLYLGAGERLPFHDYDLHSLAGTTAASATIDRETATLTANASTSLVMPSGKRFTSKPSTLNAGSKKMKSLGQLESRLKVERLLDLHGNSVRIASLLLAIFIAVVTFDKPCFGDDQAIDVDRQVRHQYLQYALEHDGDATRGQELFNQPQKAPILSRIRSSRRR